MTTNNTHGDPDPFIYAKYEALKELIGGNLGNHWVQPTSMCKCNEQGNTINGLLEKISNLENTVAELKTRIEWMENYDKKNNDNTADDSSI